jgi:hypothetical protein
MVHGENTAKMEFRTANAKSYCDAQNPRPFHGKTGKAEFRDGLMVKIRRKRPGPRARAWLVRYLALASADIHAEDCEDTA